jgi:hypothetical protein
MRLCVALGHARQIKAEGYGVRIVDETNDAVVINAPWQEELPPFEVGQRVRTNGSFTVPARNGRIGDIVINSCGHVCYILADGGMFSASELRDDRLPTPALRLNAEQLAEARAWLCECVWADIEPEDIRELGPERIEAAVRRHFDGGIESFLLACAPARGWDVCEA